MEGLRIYRISDKYIGYLKSRDSRVQHNKDKKRPYVGVVLRVGSYEYFVPMESPKAVHSKIKAGKHIMRIENGTYGLLGFNNMIPVHYSAIEMLDIDNLEDIKYAELLRRQIAFLNRHKSDVYRHASDTYFEVTNKKNKFLLQICCDFKKLEGACDRYDPLYDKKARKKKTPEKA